MGIFEMILTGAGLSMDAAAVSASNALCAGALCARQKLATAAIFGLFQGAMPVAGYITGGVFGSFLDQYAGIITLFILSVIGGKMLWESRHTVESACMLSPSMRTLLIQGLATSMDALAVGVGLRAHSANIWLAAAIIAAITFLFCLLAMALARRFGHLLGARAQAAGGVILILTGVKALF